MKLDVVGHLIAPAGRGQPPVRQPIELDARFDFEERAVRASAATVSRAYTDAVASMRAGDQSAVTSLAPDARRLFVVRQGAAAEHYLEEGFLTGDEHELLATPFDAMLLDDMLPGRAVATGECWEIPADLAAGLLAIDTVESGRIEARLEEVVEGRARVSLTGNVDGGVDGVPTHVEVSGSFAAPARTEDAAAAADADEVDGTTRGADGTPSPRHELRGRVDQLSVTIRERRQAGHVAPGFEVEARMVVARTPVSGDPRPASPAIAAGSSPRRRGDGGPGRVWYRAEDGGFDIVRDTRWRVVEDGPAGLVMRLVDRGALVGQCSIVVAAAAGIEPPPIAAVQQDIERSLAGQLTRIDEATGEERADGMRIVRVSSSGTAERLPFHWIHYVVVTPRGGRVDLAFMVQESMRSRFGDADRELVATLSDGTVPASEGTPAASAAEARPDAVTQPQGPESPPDEEAS